MATYSYCSVSDLNRRLSTAGIDLRVDDDTTTAGTAITDASTEINGYCQTRYDPVSLAASAWIRKKCTDIATFFVCERRGNPPPGSVKRAYDQAIEDLKLVESGTKKIADAPGRKTSVPVLSAPRIQLIPYPRTVIEQSRSTGNPEGYPQFTDKNDFFDGSR